MEMHAADHRRGALYSALAEHNKKFPLPLQYHLGALLLSRPSELGLMALVNII